MSGPPPKKYLIFLYHNKTKKQLGHFVLNILQKYSILPTLGTLDISSHFHQK